jgi:uncharacterized protein (TIGR00725 family)
MKIAIFSSWSHDVSNKNRELAVSIGKYLAEKDITVVSGGCSGIPAIVIESAYNTGAKTIGYFPMRDQMHYNDSQHLENIHDIKYYHQANFIEGFTARSLEMIKSCDAAIVLNGRIGTLSEFGIAIEEGRPMGVITNTGGISDEVQNILSVSNKKYTSKEIIINSDYKKIIDELIKNY